jgi:hypothetical protein
MSRFIAILVAAVFGFATLPAGAQAPAPADKGAQTKEEKKAKKQAKKDAKKAKKQAKKDAKKAEKDAKKDATK